MKNTQNVTIVLLLMTAAILTGLMAASTLYTEPAAAATSGRGGDYIVATGLFDSDADFVYVLDVANAKLNLYYPDINTKQLTLGTSVNLAQTFGSR